MGYKAALKNEHPPISSENSAEWSKDAPKAVGRWDFWCFELQEVEPVDVEIDSDGRLIAIDQHLGSTDLKSFHQGLTYPHWRPHTPTNPPVLVKTGEKQDD